jgi:hypothetical protein
MSPVTTSVKKRKATDVPRAIHGFSRHIEGAGPRLAAPVRQKCCGKTDTVRLARGRLLA